MYLKETKEKINFNSLGLYRDDGLAYMENVKEHNADKMKKELIKIFKNAGLNITVDTNLKIVNYLDVTLNLDEKLYKPYKKPNDEPQYINKVSNHPPPIIRNKQTATGKRISCIPLNKNVFNEASQIYNEALKKRGFGQNIEFIENKTNNRDNSGRRKKRTRKVIWFNPPYSKNVKTNVGKYFIQLIQNHFTKDHKLNKIFNKNIVA